MKNGGSAFPEIYTEKDGYGHLGIYSSGGMSLRDWFAGQALAGCLAGLTDLSYGDINHPGVAAACYKLADAMLAEREKEGK